MSRPGTLVIVEDERALADAAAEHIARELVRVLASAPRASLVLSGGSTPGPAYERLALRSLPWNRIDVYFADERRVPPGDPHSNYRMVRERLLDHLGAERPRVWRIDGENADADAAARAYEASLPATLDLVVLGVGEDGHTASLFPGSSALDERERRVIAVLAPAPPVSRISLAPRPLEEARDLLVLAAGRSKAAALARAREGSYEPRRCPAQLALRGTWIADREAASELARARGAAG